MIIELCGISGAGKSTLARAYVEQYKDESELITLDMYRKWPTVLHCLLYTLQHPFSFFWLVIFVLRYHVKGLFWYSLHLMFRACAKYSIAYQSPKKTVLVDEGVVHVLCVLGDTVLTNTEMDRWVGRITVPDVLILAETGDFHRFHNEHALLHPRVRQGSEALGEWERVVRAQVASVAKVLQARAIPIWKMPSKEEVSSEKMVEALHTHFVRLHE